MDPIDAMKALLDMFFWLLIAGCVLGCISIIVEARDTSKPRRKR